MPGARKVEAALLGATFLDLFGFGMILADLQLRAERMGAPGWMIGTLLAAMSATQVVMSPVWGRVGSRWNLKGALVACTGLSALGLFVYGFAATPLALLASRVLSGLGGATVPLAQACLSAATREEGRLAALGRISGAVSAGLILGPAAGGVAADLGGNLAVGLIGGSMSALGGLVLLFALPGTLAKRPEAAAAPRGRARWRHLGPVFLLSAVSWSALACLEGTFGRLIHRTLGYGEREFGLILGYEALLALLAQVFLLGVLSQRYPQRRLLIASFLLQGIGLAAMPFAPHIAPLLLASTLFGLGLSVSTPLLSEFALKASQGEAESESLGILQSTRSAAFIVGPVLGGALFDWRPAAPYVLAGAILLGMALAVRLVPAAQTAKAA